MCVLDQRWGNLLGFKYWGFFWFFWFLCFQCVSTVLLFSAAHSVGFYRSLILDKHTMFYYENENKHCVSMTTKLIITVLLEYWRDYVSECSYRHPGVRQDLLGSETGIHIHLQHLTYQHLRTISCNSYQSAVHRTNVLLTRSHCCILCYVPLLYVVSLFTLSCWIASNFEMVKIQFCAS